MHGLSRRFADRWRCKGGYRELLIIAIPLIASTSTWSIEHFIDRMFLTWYSPESIAASMPAGMLSFMISCLFIGTASYVGTFVAQYFGSGQYERCGPALWQGIYIAVIGGLIQILLIPFARQIFDLVGHAPEIRNAESTYFAILSLGAPFVIVSSALSGFLSGLGHTWPVLWVNIAATAINLLLDWLFIFGNQGFPEMGIAGAGLATVAGFAVSTVIYFLLIFRPHYASRYLTLKGWRFEWPLFKKLIRFGFPSGVQFFIEIAGYTIFILLIGRLGTISLAATNIAFNINTLAFMPMIGFGIATSVLVGQRLGENRTDLAEHSTYSAFHLTFSYMAFVAALFFFQPDFFIAPFSYNADPVTFGQIRTLSVILLKFVAVYSLFDTMGIIFASAIKGAGDTRFVMMMMLVFSFVLLIIPSYLAISVFSAGIYIAWTFATAYVSLLGLAFYFRFIGGKWKMMRVIENSPPEIPPILSKSAATGNE
ncbi:MAG: MATE family efflux transporter [Syntrophales bacterium]|jgi:MATE family multidrug resistance protein|nr:MATE family efflux transporter [Syntrophales bacterium]MDY0045471.1 MATE family efflux transporter [Syntrophales bacterium]